MSAAVVLLLTIGQAGAQATTLPPGFQDERVATLFAPTAMAFLPDGRLLVATQAGQVRIVESDVIRPGPVLDISAKVCSDDNRGLLGLAVDPAFVFNHYVFMYYTYNKYGSCTTETPPTSTPETTRSPVNRLSRFTVWSSGVIDPTSETVLLDNIASPKGFHGGGDIDFGKDGALYMTSGDGGCDFWPGIGWGGSGCADKNDAARDTYTLLGKILRITRDGGIPSDNPNQGASSARCNLTARTAKGKICQEIFATGLRSPFRFAFDPNAAGTRFFIDDVGQDTWEEIDEGKVNGDYGWNLSEAACKVNSTTDCPAPPANLTDPIYSYPHSSGCTAATAGVFVPDNLWPHIYDGAYLYADYTCGTMFRLSRDADGHYSSDTFGSDFGVNSAVDMVFGPSPGGGTSLYYLNYSGGGEVRRMTYEGGDNRGPTARVAASPSSGLSPLEVQLDGATSTDPDGDALTYVWDFGDGSDPVQTSTATVTHTYAVDGQFEAKLRVRDTSDALSAVASVMIYSGDEAPVPTITAPVSGQTFAVGQRLRLKGSATDPEDGVLPDSALRWEVKLHHNEHTHPYFPPTDGNNLVVTAPEPENLLASHTSYLEVILTATDSDGQPVTVTRDFMPNKVDLVLGTVPSGQWLDVDGHLEQTPVTVQSWEGYHVPVEVPDQVNPSGAGLEWQSWSDGGPQTRNLTTPAPSRTLTATLRPLGGSGLLGRFYNSVTPEGTSALSRVDSKVDVNWGMGGPPGIVTDGFSAWWDGDVRASVTGSYKFEVHSDDGVRLSVGGKTIIDDWVAGPFRGRSAAVLLTGGRRYRIQLRYFDQSDTAYVRLWWTTPSAVARAIIPKGKLYPSGPGLTEQLYDDTTFSHLKLTRQFEVVNHDWGSGPPHSSMPADNFSVLWTGQVEPRYRERYTFYLRADDKARVWIGNTLVADGWAASPGSEVSGSIDLDDSRKYPIRVEYVEGSGDANVKLEWSSALQSRQVIPQDRFFP